MALPGSTHTTYANIGNREDLSDVIYNVAPTDCPFMTSIARFESNAVLHEWQIDTLTAAAQNAVLEGDDATTDAVTATTRISNTNQISDKVPRVTGTQLAVVTAGRDDELSYQIVKKTKELRRDMENDLLANNAENTGDSTTARISAGVPAWITTNTSNGSGGSDGSLGNTARTDGAQRAFSESLLADVVRDVWTSGGDPDCVMLGAKNKQAMSAFGGNATRFKTAEDRKLMASIDLYQSDFGDLEIVPNRFMRARDVLILQKNMWGVSYLRPVGLTDLAKTGDSERRQVLVEYCLQSSNEAASGAVWDTNT
jgi:hypothetical protein